MKVNLIVMTLVVLASLIQLALGAQWEGLPDEPRAFAPVLADPREAVNRLAYLRDSQPYAELGLGGDIGLVAASFENDDRLTLSGRLLAVSRFESGSGAFDLLNTDYFIGAALGYQHHQTGMELSLLHQSSHLGDEMMYPPARRNMIRYHYEALRLLVDHPLGPLRLYAGGAVRIQSEPESLQGHWGLQVGAEWTGELFRKVPYYLAIDAQWRELEEWEQDLNMQAGLFLGGQKGGKHRKRLFVEIHDGLSTMGQFYQEPEDYTVLGFAMDW